MGIGVFGGTFDPPHLGHVAVAQDARAHLELDRILFVPAHVSPFKMDEAGITDPELRLRMVQAAIEGEEGLEATRLELDRDPPSYTVETLRELRRLHPDADLVLLLGADQWASFGRWKSVREISELAEVAVLAREGKGPAEVDPGLPPGLDLSPVPVEVRRVDISSTEVRDRAGAGQDIQSLIPEGVHALIEAHALYRATPEGARQRTVSTC